MSKATVFVLSCSVLIIVLFSVFCYLLNTVDPDSYLNVTAYRRMDGSHKQDVLYPDQELSAKDNVHYGMEKVAGDFEKKTSKAEVTWDGDQRKLHPVLIPLVKPTTGHQVRNTTYYTRYHRSFDEQKHVTVMVHPMKEHRRSLKNNDDSKPVKQGESTNVLLKIIDDSGQARMEVIVDSGQIHYKDPSMNKFNKSKEDELHVYEIKPNNTLLYNIPEQSLKIVSDVFLKNKS